MIESIRVGMGTSTLSCPSLLKVMGAEEITLEFNDPALLTEDVEEISEISNEQLEETEEELPTTVAETPEEAAASAESAPIPNGSSAVVEALPLAEETVPDVETTVDKSSDISKPVSEEVVEVEKHEAVLPDPSAFNTAATPVSRGGCGDVGVQSHSSDEWHVSTAATTQPSFHFS